MSSLGLDLSIRLSRAAGGPAPWAPTDVAGLELFLDADDTSVLFQNSGGTGAVTTTSDPVGYAGDKSGNNRHFVQATSGQRLLWQSDGLGGGHASILADDVDDRLDRSPAFGVVGAQTWALTFRLAAVPGSSEIDGVLDLSAGGKSSPLVVCNFSGYQNITWCFDFSGSVTAVGINPTLDTTRHSLLIIYNGSGSTTPGNYSVYLDGVAQTVNASSAFVATSGSTLANLANGSFPAALHLGKAIVYSGALSGADLTNLQAYLAGAIA